MIRGERPQENAAVVGGHLRARSPDLGVVVQPAVDHQDVLEVDPPLLLARGSADHFADALGRVLTDGW